MPRIRLPHINNNQKWAYLNEVITEALNVGLPTWKILKDNINNVVSYFELLVYEKLKAECGLVDIKKKISKTEKPPPRLLQKLRNRKRELRRQFRRLKKQRCPDHDHIRSVHRELMKFVRLHNDFKKQIDRDNQIKFEWKERRNFLSNLDLYASTLLAPSQSGVPNFSKQTADEYFKKTYSDADRSFKYMPPPGLPRPKALFSSNI